MIVNSYSGGYGDTSSDLTAIAGDTTSIINTFLHPVSTPPAAGAPPAPVSTSALATKALWIGGGIAALGLAVLVLKSGYFKSSRRRGAYGEIRRRRRRK